MVDLALERIPFFRGLSPDELKAVKSCLRERSFQKGESLFQEGKSCERVFFVRSGRVKLFRLSPDGREQILETLGPGDTCACNPGATEWHCSSSGEAVADSIVWFLSREDYVRLVRTNAKTSAALNRLFAERLQCFSSLIEEVSLKDSKKRLVKFLLDLLEINGSDNPPQDVLAVSFTREELAQRLGVARETVSRQLNDLKSKKLINLKPKQIVIRKKAGLEELLREAGA